MTLVRRREILDPGKLFLETERREESGDFSNAFKSLLAGARLGHTSCQVNLGNFYASGKGTRKNLQKPAYWYKRAYRDGARDAA